MVFIKRLTIISAYFFLVIHLSKASASEEGYEFPETEQKKSAVAMLVNLQKDNDKFVSSHTESSYFDSFIDSQHPRMTLVMCVDSRVHHHAFDQTPDNDIFTVRNLSGQYASSKGGIIYGVKHTKTPLLIVMGHDDCGAVKAKTQLQWLEDHPESEEADREDLKEISKLEREISKELSKVFLAQAAIPPGDSMNKKELEKFKYIVHQNIKFNIHRQVEECLLEFYEEVIANRLIIAGVLYDFQGREQEGRGRLVWLDARDKENASEFIGINNEHKKYIKISGVKSTVEVKPESTRRKAKKKVSTSVLAEEVSNEGQPLYKIHNSIGLGVKRLKDSILLSPLFRE